jgi:hypothetical protein
VALQQHGKKSWIADPGLRAGVGGASPLPAALVRQGDRGLLHPAGAGPSLLQRNRIKDAAGDGGCRMGGVIRFERAIASSAVITKLVELGYLQPGAAIALPQSHGRLTG